MMRACQTFLRERLEELTLRDGVTSPYRGDDRDPGKNIFFEDLPHDFLKDADYAVCCLPLKDNNKKYGKRIAVTRTLGASPQYEIATRRYLRELTYRCLLYGPGPEIWGDETHTGMGEQFGKAISNYKVIADEDNSAIKIEPQELARPWDTDVEMERKLRRPRVAILRVLFIGGIQTGTTVEIINGIDIVPKIPMTGAGKAALTSESTGNPLVSEDNQPL
jgi:hypothetical protein